MSLHDLIILAIKGVDWRIDPMLLSSELFRAMKCMMYLIEMDLLFLVVYSVLNGDNWCLGWLRLMVCLVVLEGISLGYFELWEWRSDYWYDLMNSLPGGQKPSRDQTTNGPLSLLGQGTHVLGMPSLHLLVTRPLKGRRICNDGFLLPVPFTKWSSLTSLIREVSNVSSIVILVIDY